MVVLTQHVNERRASVAHLGFVERPVDELNRHGVEVLAQVGFPTYDSVRVPAVHVLRQLLDHRSARQSFLIRHARRMHHVFAGVEQQVVDEREQYAVHRFVHIDGSELSRLVLGYLCGVRRRYLIPAVTYRLVHRGTHFLRAKVTQYLLADTLSETFRNRGFPSFGVRESHL